MASCVEAPLADFAVEVDRIRRAVAVADVQAVSRRERRTDADRAKSFVYVWLAAALEHFVTRALQSAIREINRLSPMSHDLRCSLWSLVGFQHLQAIRDLAGLKRWERKVELFECVSAAETAALSEEQLPLDRRTLRADHFYTVWKVFGLPGQPLPHPRLRFALEDLAEGRNDVAHGTASPDAFGRRKTYRDTVRLIEQMEELAEHLAIAFESYFLSRAYLRPV